MELTHLLYTDVHMPWAQDAQELPAHPLWILLESEKSEMTTILTEGAPGGNAVDTKIKLTT